MELRRKEALFAGILFLLQLIPYYIGHDYILGSILYNSDYLSQVYEHKNLISIAVLLELTSAFSFIGFSVILFQYLKKVNLIIAIINIGLRFVEFGIIILSEIKLMVLVATSEQFNSTENNLVIQLIADSILAEWEWTTLIYMIIFCLNALLFYYLLYRSHLIPRFISIWGFIGALIALFAPLLLMFGWSAGGMMLYILIGFNELFLAVWLIIKGFNSVV